MKSVAFRTDASLQIGTGHVMRCLTLANALKAKGVECVFICRAHKGNLIDYIRDNGFEVKALPLGENSGATDYAAWLGATWEDDAIQTLLAMHDLTVDWLIVDHYALDARWETLMRPHCAKLMVIDDLADRPHDCDLLLDQNLGREPSDYTDLTRVNCRLCIGTNFALLRPEFLEARAFSLKRRAEPHLKHLLITMGGVDQDNATGAVLKALKQSALPDDTQITVVMGTHAPWLSDVQSVANDMPWKTEVKIGVKDMARLMSKSDLAIGAAGSTSWERCCLGLPSITLKVADNQTHIANALQHAGATFLIEIGDLEIELIDIISDITKHPRKVTKISSIAANITDGNGSSRIVEIIQSVSI